MKKIIISLAALSSVFAFAIELKVPSHRLEGDLGLAFQMKKDASANNKIKAWQKYTKLGVTYIPEWNQEINDKVGLTFGPRANFGVETNISRESGDTEEGLYGIRGSLGGELDLDFKLPQGEVVYLGFDANAGGVGYVRSWKVENRGVTADLGISVGGKINEKIKLGARIGYEFEGSWEKKEAKKVEASAESSSTTSQGGSVAARAAEEQPAQQENKMQSAHNLTIGLRFGYLLGK